MKVPGSLCDGLMEAIPRRCSWRRYTGADLSEDQKSILRSYAEELNSISKYVRLQIVEGDVAKAAMTSPLGVGVIRGIVFCAALIVPTDAPHPEADIAAGVIGELFVLKAISLSLQNVWIGAINILCQSKVLEKHGIVAHDREALVAILPVGHAVNPEYGRTKRPPMEKFLVCPSSLRTSSEVTTIANAVILSPSALNRMPYKLVVKQAENAGPGAASISGVQLSMNNGSVSGSHMSHWLDAGVGTAHALLALQTVLDRKDGIEISYLLGEESYVTLQL